MTGCRHKALLRVLSTLKKMERSPWVCIVDLAREHGVSVRTIRRDMEVLELAGYPLRYEHVGSETIPTIEEGRITTIWSLVRR